MRRSFRSFSYFCFEMQGTKTTVFLLLGGNIGNVLETFTRVYKEVENLLGPIVQKSSIYETAAWGKTDQPNFLNQVLEIQTCLTPEATLSLCQATETKLGRQRFEHWGARTIDIDILFFGEEVIDSETLKVPHPQIPNRKFTLIPLAEIAADFSHPKLGKSVADLLATTEDELEVKLINPIKAGLQ